MMGNYEFVVTADRISVFLDGRGVKEPANIYVTYKTQKSYVESPLILEESKLGLINLI